MALSEREQVLVEYALLLGIRGEDDVQVLALLNKYADRQDLWSALVAITEYYRQLPK